MTLLGLTLATAFLGLAALDFWLRNIFNAIFESIVLLLFIALGGLR